MSITSSTATFSRLAPVALILFALLFPLIITIHQHISDGFWQIEKIIIASFFFCSAIWGGILIYFNASRDKEALLIVLVMGCVLELGSVLGYWHIPLAKLILWLSIGVWLFCIGECVVGVLEDSKAKRAIDLTTFLLCLAMPLFSVVAGFCLYWTAVFHPKIDDQLLYAVDATLRFNPSFLVGKYFADFPEIMQSIIYSIYVTLPLMWALVYIKCRKNKQVEQRALIMECIVAAVLGILIYNLIPAYGPINMFKSTWPWYSPHALMHPAAIVYTGLDPRNCMPSLHAVWALCIWRHAQSCGRAMRIGASFWLVCLLVSTLALGQHYLIDIVVAFAFFGLVRGCCATALVWRDKSRIQTILVSGSICIAWFVLVFFGLPLLRLSPVVPWFLYGATIIMICRIEQSLTYSQQADVLNKNPVLVAQ